MLQALLLLLLGLIALSLPACATTSAASRASETSAVAQALPCAAHKTKLDGKPAYIVCGQAERFFDDDTESELMAEAELEAKAALLKFLAGDRPAGDVEIQMSGFRLLKATRQGTLYTGRYGVLVEEVRVKGRQP
jgi:hypothetical protein